MIPRVQKFRSHAEADEADRNYYQSLTPKQRLDILLELIDAQRPPGESSQRIACVCRIITRDRTGSIRYDVSGG